MLILATAAHLPDLAPCDRPLIPALQALGLDPRVVAWDDPTVDFSGLCIIRTCWDYHLRRDDFLAWAARVPNLVNPYELVRWNSHKAYLRDLKVPTVPTTYAAAGERIDPQGQEVVVKPAVSASAYKTIRTREPLVADREVLVQPYLKAVEDPGECALLFIEGEFTHAVRKAPVLSGVPEAFTPTQPTAAQLALARQALAGLAEVPLYARVDLLEDLVMELELVEPSLYLTASPAATARLAGAIAERLARV